MGKGVVFEIEDYTKWVNNKFLNNAQGIWLILRTVKSLPQVIMMLE